jgi:hypothetical protein
MNSPTPNQLPTRRPDSNPFSTCWTEPGAIRFIFTPGVTASGLVESLSQHRWLGQIVGPHGSGKSTLLAELACHLQQAKLNVVSVRLSEGQRRLPANAEAEVDQGESTLLVIDGFEQLRFWKRWQLIRRCRRHSTGLLVTSHKSVGLPTLLETEVSLELSETIVNDLLADAPSRLPDGAVKAAYHRTGGNLRDLLFEMYDIYAAK